LLDALKQAEEATTVVLTIERDGRTLSATFTGEEFKKARGAGLALSVRRHP
jgi:hypothetical protein